MGFTVKKKPSRTLRNLQYLENFLDSLKNGETLTTLVYTQPNTDLKIVSIYDPNDRSKLKIMYALRTTLKKK